MVGSKSWGKFKHSIAPYILSLTTNNKVIEMNKGTIIAIFYMVFATNIVCISDLIMRNLAVAENLTAVQTSFYRAVAMVVLLMLLLKVNNLSTVPKIKNKKLQIMRGFIYGLTSMGLHFAFIKIPMAQAIVIFFIGPISAVIMAQFILKEKVGLIRYVAVVLGFMGAIIAINPTDFDNVSLAHISALFSGLIYGAYIVLSRKLNSDLAPLQHVYVTQIFSLAPIIFVLFFVLKPVELSHLFPSFLGAGITVFSHWLFMKAMKMENASLLSPFIYTQVIGMALTGYYGLGQIPTANVFMGSLVIIIAGIMITVREYKINH